MDEFSNYYETEIGQACIKVLTHLGYNVLITDHEESGRSHISKGLLDQARDLANKNIEHFKALISEKTPLVGIEPSAILTFRDEYLRLAKDKDAAMHIASNTLTLEEFFSNEIKAGRIKSEQFDDRIKDIRVHGHCQQNHFQIYKAPLPCSTCQKNFNVRVDEYMDAVVWPDLLAMKKSIMT